MKKILVLGKYIQGYIAGALCAKRGMDVTLVQFENQESDLCTHIPFALPHYIIEELALENHGLEIPSQGINNPFKKLPFYDGLKILVRMFQSLEHDNPNYKEKAWRDTWGTFEIGRVLSQYDDNIQSLFAQHAQASLIDLLNTTDLNDTEKAQIIAACTIGSKTDPDAAGSAAAILPACATYEQDDSALFLGDLTNLKDALKQSCMSNNANIVTEQHIEKIEVEGNEIKSVHLNGGEIIQTDHYLLDDDPVTFFEQHIPDFPLKPAFKNRVIRKQNLKECVRARVSFSVSISPNTQILVDSPSDILTAKSQMKTEGGAQKPVISIVPTANNKLDVIAQYFDPSIEGNTSAKIEAIKNTLIKHIPNIENQIDAIDMIEMPTQFGQPTFVGSMPLLQLFKVFFGHHSLAYDMPLDNLLLCGYGDLCAPHHHVKDGGIRVSSLLQSL